MHVSLFQMLEAATSQEDTDDEIDLKEILDKARDHLNNSKFDDAEAAFLKLYQQIQVSARGSMSNELLQSMWDVGAKVAIYKFLDTVD